MFLNYVVPWAPFAFCYTDFVESVDVSKIIIRADIITTYIMLRDMRLKENRSMNHNRLEFNIKKIFI